MAWSALFSMSAPQHVALSVFAGWTLILIVLAVASMVVGNLAALAQTSVRRLLAYSAIAHAGYILLGLAYFSWGSRSAQADSLLRPHLRPHHHRRIRRCRRGRARHRLRQTRRLPRPAKAQPAPRRRSARALPLARRNPAAGRLLGQVQSLRRQSSASHGGSRSRSPLLPSPSP